MSNYRLMSPQWIGLQEKAAGKPKELRSTCHTSDEDATIVLDDRKKNVTVKNDPAMIVPVLNVNPGIHNFEDFSASICTVIQDYLDEPSPQMTLNYDEL